LGIPTRRIRTIAGQEADFAKYAAEVEVLKAWVKEIAADEK
jgi:hypothetical protein